MDESKHAHVFLLLGNEVASVITIENKKHFRLLSSILLVIIHEEKCGKYTFIWEWFFGFLGRNGGDTGFSVSWDVLSCSNTGLEQIKRPLQNDQLF